MSARAHVGPRGFVRLWRFYRFVRDRYCTVDPRTAGIYRIVLGVLLCLDCLRHWREAGFLYSNDGVLSNHYHLFRPTSSILFSFFNAFSTRTEVDILFALGLMCHFALLVGYKTRVAAILGFLWVVSRDSRIPLVENGGYIVQNLACLWACFLPLGERFSIDAWRASLRAKKETTLVELSETARAPRSSPQRSLIGLAVLSNFALIYFFNVVNKTGNLWRKGDTIHYVLHLDRLATGVAVFARETLPSPMLKVVDFSVLACEAMICLCVMWPWGRRWTRVVAMVLVVSLHTTLGIFLRLGPFSWAMITWSTLLLLPIHFDRIERWERRAAEKRGDPERELAVDVTRPFALAFARVVARLDTYQRVTFVPAVSGGDLGVRVSGASDWTFAPNALVRELAVALPFGRLAYRALNVVLLGQRSFIIKAVFSRGERMAHFFGWTTAPGPEPRPASRVALGARWARAGTRELVLVYLMVCCTLQAWMENKVIPKSLPPPLKPNQVLTGDEKRAYDFLNRLFGDKPLPLKPDKSPEFLQLTITYARIFQGWGMFAPNPIRDDGVLAIDALTIDGRHIDPLTGREPDLMLSDSRGEGLSQLRQDYGNRIRLDRNETYREGLRDYIVRYHERTGNPNDRVIAIDVYWVRDLCPPPGQLRPTDDEAVPILSWRQPNYKPEPGQPALPPALKKRSAEKDDKNKEKEAPKAEPPPPPPPTAKPKGKKK